MITEVKTFPLNPAVTVTEGDVITVSHNGNIVFTDRVDFVATWTHSIMFKLSGQVQWVLGTQETINWLRSLQNSEPIKRPLTVGEQLAIMEGRGGY